MSPTRSHAEVTEVTMSDSPQFQESRQKSREVTHFAKAQVRKSRISHGISHGTPPYVVGGRGGAANQNVTSHRPDASADAAAVKDSDR